MNFPKWKETIIASQLERQGRAFLANIIENHDEPRGASRYLPEYARNPEGIKMPGTVSLLLRGMPFLYQEQEIGMCSCPTNDIHEYDDLETGNQYHMALEAGLTKEEALKYLQILEKQKKRSGRTACPNLCRLQIWNRINHRKRRLFCGHARPLC